MGLSVAVTGPTGEIGKPFIRALERCPEVELPERELERLGLAVFSCPPWVP